MQQFPFEASESELRENLDAYVAVVFSSLESEFLEIPKGEGFIEYPVFEQGYEALKQATGGFVNVSPDILLAAVKNTPISFIVLRAMLGFTPPEWAYVAAQRTGVAVPQGAARSIDRKIRLTPTRPLSESGVTAERIRALVKTASELLTDAAPTVDLDTIHRLDKADTRTGLEGVKSLSRLGAPYAMLLYERFMGRPFAGHRDSVSELIGDELELTIEKELDAAGISFRKTRRAERIPGFDQAPDFIVPSEFNPQVVIEAKITEDDGTARDKVTRIQHLAELSRASGGYEVIACIGGRGFGERRSNMAKLLLDTNGKVFTRKTIRHLVDCTRLREFRTR